MNNKKTKLLKIPYEDWRKLSQLKLDKNYTRLSDVVHYLLERELK